MTDIRKGRSRRKMRQVPATQVDRDKLNELSQKATYTGNPAHKKNAGDYGLHPPSSPREGKTLCDPVGITKVSRALSLLRKAISMGLVSVQERNGWPQNVWGVEAG